MQEPCGARERGWCSPSERSSEPPVGDDSRLITDLCVEPTARTAFCDPLCFSVWPETTVWKGSERSQDVRQALMIHGSFGKADQGKHDDRKRGLRLVDQVARFPGGTEFVLVRAEPLVGEEPG